MSSDQLDLWAWSTLFWQRVDQGGGSPGTGFAFTNATMNNALFNPLRGVRATLEKVGLVPVGACDELATPTAAASPEGLALRPAFRKAMLEGKIVTDVAANPPGTFQHANLILAAPASAGLTVYVDGTKLVLIKVG